VRGCHIACGGDRAWDPVAGRNCSGRRRDRFSRHARVSKEVPVGFQRIRLEFGLDTDANEEQLATLIRLTERYCVVYQTLKRPPGIDVNQHAIAE
jgi:hypothetical protein